MKEITFMNYFIYLQNYAKISKFVYNYYKALFFCNKFKQGHKR